MKYKTPFIAISVLTLLALVAVVLLAEKQIDYSVTGETIAVKPGVPDALPATEMETAVKENIGLAMDDFKYKISSVPTLSEQIQLVIAV